MIIQYEDEGLVIFESDLFRTCSSLIKSDDPIIVVDPNWLPGEVDFIFNKDYLCVFLPLSYYPKQHIRVLTKLEFGFYVLTLIARYNPRISVGDSNTMKLKSSGEKLKV